MTSWFSRTEKHHMITALSLLMFNAVKSRILAHKKTPSSDIEQGSRHTVRCFVKNRGLMGAEECDDRKQFVEVARADITHPIIRQSGKQLPLWNDPKCHTVPSTCGVSFLTFI